MKKTITNNDFVLIHGDKLLCTKKLLFFEQFIIKNQMKTHLLLIAFIFASFLSPSLSLAQTEKVVMFSINQPEVLEVTISQPVLSSNQVQLIALASGGTPNYTYSWTPAEGMNNPFIANPTISVPSQKTTYTVEVKDAHGCITFASVEVSPDISSIENVDATESSSVDVIWDSAGKYIQLRFYKAEDKANISIFSSQGTFLKQESLTNIDSQTSYHVSGANIIAGTYLVAIKTKSYYIVKKLIISK